MHREAAIYVDDTMPELVGRPEPEQTTRDLTAWFTRFRIAMATGIRHELPWETLPMAQVEILQQLTFQPAIRMSELAQRQRLAINTVSTLIKALESKGYVARHPDPQDGRAQLLEPTESGKAALADWLQINETFLLTAFDRLPEEARESLRAAIPALLELVGAMEESHSTGSAS